MTYELSSTSGRQTNAASANVMPSDENSGNKCPRNVSVQTGEEFSPEFLKDRRRINVVNDLDQSPANKACSDVVPNHHLLYEDLTGVLGTKNTDSEGRTEFAGFTPSKGYGLNVDNKTYLDVTSRYCPEYKAGGQQQAKFSDDFYSEIGGPIPAGRTIHASDSPNAVQAYNQASGVSDSSFTGKMKFLCSFGGKILPRPNDGKLRYVGGETRIISIRQNLTYCELVKKTTAICNHPHTIKYQLPCEDLDALISVSSDEDLQHMIEEYHDLERSSQRLRIFLESSFDSESPCSLEARTLQQSDVDYQYVVAVNGMLDPSHRRSSSRESNLDSSPTLQRESPTSLHVLEKWNGGNNINNKSMFPIPHTHLPNAPALSEVPGYYNNYHVDTMQVISSQQLNSHLIESNPTRAVHSHFRSCSKDFDSSSLYDHAGFDYRKKLHSSQDTISLSPASDVQATLYQRIPHLPPESQMKNKEMPGVSLEEVADTSLNLVTEKLPSLAISNLLGGGTMHQQHIADEKYQLSRNEDQSCMEVPNIKEYTEYGQDTMMWLEEADTSPDQGRKNNDISNNYVANANVVECKINLPKILCQPDSNLSFLVSLSKSQVHEDNSSSLLTNSEENSRKHWKEETGTYQVSPVAHEFLVKNPTKIKNQKSSSPNKINSKEALHRFHGIKPVRPEGMVDQPPVQGYESSFAENLIGPLVTDFSLVKYTTKDALHRETSVHEGTLYDFHRSGDPPGRLIDETSVHSRPRDNHQGNGETELPLIVEDVTDNVPPDVPSSSTAIPHVQDETIDGSISCGEETQSESFVPESDSDDDKVVKDDNGESISDSAIIEMEAGIYGLQIIKNADLEDLQELGSGTFGTVFHGKWRGTDVAIKRIKKSCFAGRSSEQEKLTKDFWREAHILSKLHHPNIVAFYGVVPDGLGGTLATVTEYMANGSLRHVLLRKDRALDRRKKVIIALDAAFGMEYLHLKNIVHFDLKCDNLLVNLGDPQRPVCKVGDFGLSRIKRNTLVSGGVRGTLPWMAPELLNGSSSRVSEKVDVFSFGISMWEIWTGEEPYADMHCGAIIGGIVNNTLRPPIPGPCDSEWRKLMEECWSHDPAARPSFTEITNRLRNMSVALQSKRYNRVKR
ncbi:mitosis inhibitor kinase wee1 [Olea europaea subsp. europaea]|uniref:Mitosis inhibitor kinase wee1 n=1 Tax=Olea europaea subsp. europaea TaxID=158383 RepID=A0A8S0UH05_OLEEU|nr:mitosis inhibitor kinase wee1 [Olea europaea subsp. europaea]